MSQYAREATILSLHLVGASPSDLTLSLYERAIQTKVLEFSESNKKIWDLIMKHPYLITAIDGALALLDRWSPVRLRIFLMQSILEVDPKLSHLFLPKNYSWFEKIKIILRGAWVIMQQLAGIAILKIYTLV